MKYQIKSIFEQISEKIFVMKNLDEAKLFISQFVEEKGINEKDKKLILLEVNNASTLYKLQNYICNSLLKYEGLSVNKKEKE